MKTKIMICTATKLFESYDLMTWDEVEKTIMTLVPEHEYRFYKWRQIFAENYYTLIRRKYVIDQETKELQLYGEEKITGQELREITNSIERYENDADEL